MDCSHFSADHCRSCTLLPQPYPQQLASKQADAQQQLANWPQLNWLAPQASAEQGCRNKAKMVVSGSCDEPVLGIINHHGQAVDLCDCPLYPTAIQLALPLLRQFIRDARLPPYDINARRGELKYLLLTVDEPSGQLMLRFVLRSRESEGRIRKQLPQLLGALPTLQVVSINLQPQPMAIVEGTTEILLTSATALPMQLGELPLQLQPQGFFQVNTAVAAALYKRAADWAATRQPAAVWDLFCGVGGFALACAQRGLSVTGIEVSAAAIASATAAATALALHQAQFRALDATDFALGQSQLPELVIVNPPRRGIGQPLAHFLDQSACQSLIYSSCNVASLVRDLAWLPSFIPTRGQLFDMFPHTSHYELLLQLERRQP